MQSAQTWARNNLARLYPIEYRNFYLQHKGSATGAKANSLARSRALSSLVLLYKEEYRSLYREGRNIGFPGRLKKEREVRV